MMSKSTDGPWKPKNILQAMDLILSRVASIENPRAKVLEFDYWGQYEAHLMKPYLTEDMYVLDFGGGIGRVAKHVAPLVKEVVVSDISQRMLELGEKEYCKSIDSIKWVLNKDVLPFPDNTFDFAYSLLCVWHLLVGSHDALYWFEEIKRVIKPGGLFYYDMDQHRPDLLPTMQPVDKFMKYPDKPTVCYVYRKVETEENENS